MARSTTASVTGARGIARSASASSAYVAASGAL